MDDSIAEEARRLDSIYEICNDMTSVLHYGIVGGPVRPSGSDINSAVPDATETFSDDFADGFATAIDGIAIAVACDRATSPHLHADLSGTSATEFLRRSVAFRDFGKSLNDALKMEEESAGGDCE